MKRRFVIINTVANILLFFVSFGFQLASVMTGAAASGTTLINFLGLTIAMLGYWFPAVPIISVLGMWIAHFKGKERLTRQFAWSSWVYLVVLLIFTFTLFGVS